MPTAAEQHQRRWLALGLLAMAQFVVVLDGLRAPGASKLPS